jgi:mono/diheme cytochrome c family protein
MSITPRLLVPAAGLLLTLAACQTMNTVPPVTPALISAGAKAGATAADLEAGRRIYAGKCTACHSAEPVGRYSSQEWPGILASMSARSKLGATERGQLRAYVFAVLEAPEAAAR